MKNITCIIIDDERHALQVLEKLIGQIPWLLLLGSFTDADAGLNAALETPPDVAFIDVDMPRMNGLELAQKLPQRTLTVFTTAYREYAADAYEQAAADYLIKPIIYERFLRCLNRLADRLPDQKAREELFVRDVKNEQTVAIRISEISHISAALNYLNIYLPTGKIVVYSGIGRFLPLLPENFCRIHRSHIVNLTQVRLFRSELLTLADGTILPVGRNYLTPLRQALNR